MSVDSDQLAVTSEESPQSSGLRSLSCDPAGSPQEKEPLASSLESQDPEPALLTDVPKLEASATLNPLPPSEDSPLAGGELTSVVPAKTQSVRVSRGGGAEVLGPAAQRAARSGNRNDVHEYMRLRRSYV